MHKQKTVTALLILAMLLTPGCGKVKISKAPKLDIKVEWLTDNSSEDEGQYSERTDDPNYDESADESNSLNDEEFSIAPGSVMPNPVNQGKRIVCFGDSLTQGTGGDGVTMPDTIAEYSGAEVLNYGVYAEMTSCIAARQGGNPQALVEDIVIPADTTPVKAQVSGGYGYEMLLVFGDAGVNNVTLGGIEGTYTLEGENRVFTRLTPGEATPLPEGTPLITHAMADKREDDILVIWTGHNDEIKTTDNIPGLIEKIDKMIAYHGGDKYVVVSLTCRHGLIPVVDETNDALKAKYGEHYLDLRSFLVNDSLEYLSIEPTEKDKEAIAIGDVPYSIRFSMEEDENHGNADFYRLAGIRVYLKLVSLGYID